jgi:hypothetical protein
MIRVPAAIWRELARAVTLAFDMVRPNARKIGREAEARPVVGGAGAVTAEGHAHAPE